MLLHAEGVFTATTSAVGPVPISSNIPGCIIGCQQVLLLGGHSDLITFVNFGADGKKGLSAGFDGTVRYWNLGQ